MQIDSEKTLKGLAGSPEIFVACEKIGREFDLHIDQVGELDAQIRQILLGNAQSKEFAKDIQEYLEIDAAVAEKIVEKVNQDVFQVIKDKLKGGDPAVSHDNSPLEQAGGFSIEPTGENGDGDRKEGMKEGLDMSSASVRPVDREKILASVENPIPTKGVPMRKELEMYAEPLVDSLLANPTGNVEKKIVQAPENLPIIEEKSPPRASLPAEKPAVMKKPSGPDLYREPVK